MKKIPLNIYHKIYQYLFTDIKKQLLFKMLHSTICYTQSELANAISTPLSHHCFNCPHRCCTRHCRLVQSYIIPCNCFFLSIRNMSQNNVNKTIEKIRNFFFQFTTQKPEIRYEDDYFEVGWFNSNNNFVSIYFTLS